MLPAPNGVLGETENSEVRVVAAEALGAVPAVAALTECLKDKGEDEHVRRVASEAVVRSRGVAEQAMAAESRSLAAKGALRREI